MLVVQSCPTLWDPVDCSPPGFSVHGNSPGKNTGVGCHALLHGIFPTWGSNTGLLHCRQILYHLSHRVEFKSQSYWWMLACRLFLTKIFVYLVVLGLTCNNGIFFAICRIFSCSIWDLVPWTGIEPGHPALGAQNHRHCTTRRSLACRTLTNLLIRGELIPVSQPCIQHESTGDKNVLPQCTAH